MGFRPYIYRLASEEQVAGCISNDTSGVTIEIEGKLLQVESFLRRLPLEPPPLAHIASIESHEVPCQGDKQFRIAESAVLGHVNTQIPPDAATCEDCLQEISAPDNRRYHYPFTNCTNCGPRFTITRSIPYDRPQTSMSKFAMCSACQTEYDDPLDRRFHAQPNACWNCGPQLWMTNAEGARLLVSDPLHETVTRLVAGEILAIKGIGGFHLAVDATNGQAVKRLRERKHRFGKPLAVMLQGLDAVEQYCNCDGSESSLLTGVQRPIVILRMKVSEGIAESVAPGVPWLGVFLPYTPLHHLLFADHRLQALVMTSANLSEEPIAIDNAEALERLGKIADAFLFHDREILQRCDDSVLAVVGGQSQIIRRARGYVPLPIRMPMESPPLLAVGGQLKSVFCLAAGRNAYQSQHLGDLENLAGLEFFDESLKHLEQTFDITPLFVAHDLHPGYSSTQWAMRQHLPLIAVQHHHAHIASCMAEHSLTAPVVGIALDGTGLGTDGHVWGGEVMIASHAEFKRVGHLKYVPMPGSAAAIREPWRMGFSHLQSALGEEAFQPIILALLGATEREARALDRMTERNINSPLTSSCGRLFDAAAALIMGRHVVDYEAQAAIELEGLAIEEPDLPPRKGYHIMMVMSDEQGSRSYTLDPASLWRELLHDIQSGIARSTMSMRFHVGVADAYTDLAIAAREEAGTNQVCLSGGVFHNALLHRLLADNLRRADFEVYSQTLVSPGDGGISYGQAVVAAARLASPK